MLINPTVLQKIKAIIEKHHSSLLLQLVGSEFLDDASRKVLKEAGIDLTQKESILSQIYHHNFINTPGAPSAPKTLDAIRKQLKGKSLEGNLHKVSLEHLNSNILRLINKYQTDITARVEGMIQNSNASFKFQSLTEPDRPKNFQELMRKHTVAQLKSKLQEYEGEANRNWHRVVHTEISNAIGLGSMDKIVDQNKGKRMAEVYCYRIIKDDTATCRWCREFYLDSDGSPRLHKVSDLIANGSNYGKKTQDWQPTYLATHVNDRCSSTLELKPGWKVMPGGAPEYIGKTAWANYIKNKIK